jgi:hypothetical protein
MPCARWGCRTERAASGAGPGAPPLTGGRRLPPDELAELLTKRLLDDAPDDDVAFLLYRCGDVPAEAG